MSAIGGVTLNIGASLPFGDLCNWYNPNCNGYNPVTRTIPGTLRPKAYKSRLEQMDRTAVDNITSYLNGRTWSNYDEFRLYLGEIQDDMENNCIWLWGSFTNGGTFFYPTTSDSACGLCTIDYFTSGEDDEQEWGAYISSLSCEYEMSIPGGGGATGDTYLAFFNIWDRHDDVGDLVPPQDDYYGFYYIKSAAPTLYEGVDQLLPSSDPLNPHVLEWQQAESVYYRDWTYFKSNYLRNYTQIIDIQGNNDHPWQRYVQERVGVNGIVFLGMSESQYNVTRITASPMGGATYEPGENPYGGNDSGEGGGDGDGSDYSDNIGDGGLPSSTILGTNICSVYLPTPTNLVDLNDFLFSDISDSLVTHIKKIFVDPMQSILNLSLCHLNLPYTSASEICFAGVGSGVTSPVADSIYYKVEYSISLREWWGSALDYSSYTKIKIYLPYCGIYELSADDFMSKDGRIDITYKIDILTGMCVAMVKCNKTDNSGNYLNSVLYQFNGNIFLNVPIVASSWDSMFQSVLNMASVAVSPSPSALVGMAEDVMSQKVSVQKSGQIGSNFGYMGIQTPFLIIERPAQSLPANFGSYNGYPSNIYGQVSTFKGYTEVDTDALWTNNFGHATSEECDMIKEIMNGGVYL